jgi:hypothetical protein
MVNLRKLTDIRLYSQVKTTEEQQKSVKRLLKKEKDRRRKIAALGIDYDFPGYVSVNSLQVQFS